MGVASNLMTFLRHAHSPLMDVFIGSVDGNSCRTSCRRPTSAPTWRSRSRGSTRTPSPQPTIDVLTRRMGHAMIYVWDASDVVSANVVRELITYGPTMRITETGSRTSLTLVDCQSNVRHIGKVNCPVRTIGGTAIANAPPTSTLRPCIASWANPQCSRTLASRRSMATW